tara:strand:- start:1415 stop:1738 length:324 start_codon:yes stop_codon:yes gene_type:complete
VKVGDLVCEKRTGRYGIVEKIDIDYYGATQAFKIYQEIGRGKVVRGDLVDGMGPTKDGKRDRVLVCWSDSHPEYLESTELKVISECRQKNHESDPDLDEFGKGLADI